MKNQEKQQNIKNNNNSYYDIINDVYNQCSKLGGSKFIKCVDEHMEQKGLDRKTRQYIIWDELLGLD